jgi:hypothetical protein
VTPSFKADDVEEPPNEAVEAFHNYFLNVTETLKVETTNDTSPISLIRKYYQSDFPPMRIIPITEGDVKCINSSLKSKNSSVYYGISTKILKLCG